MSQEAGDAVLELERMGVIFSRGDDGKLGTRRFGGRKLLELFLLEQSQDLLCYMCFMNSH